MLRIGQMLKLTPNRKAVVNFSRLGLKFSNRKSNIIKMATA
jgi:hypothetical protein